MDISGRLLTLLSAGQASGRLPRDRTANHNSTGSETYLQPLTDREPDSGSVGGDKMTPLTSVSFSTNDYPVSIGYVSSVLDRS